MSLIKNTVAWFFTAVAVTFGYKIATDCYAALKESHDAKKAEVVIDSTETEEA